MNGAQMTDGAQILRNLKQLSCSGEFLSDFIEKFPASSHVKDVQTKKYLTTNHHMVINCGLQTVDDIIGFTPHDICFNSAIQKKRNLSQPVISFYKGSIHFINKIENYILSTKHAISTKRFILSSKGNVELQHVTKIGVPGHGHKIIALLSVFLDLTPQVPLPRLFKIYQEFYSKKEAVQKFLNHFNIESYFDPLTPLSDKEMQVLLSMRDDSRHKVVANTLGCSVTTASNHISNIQSKLKSCTLYDVLSKLPAMPRNEQSTYLYI